MLKVVLADAARRVLGASTLQPLFFRLAGLDESKPYTHGGEITLDTNTATADPSGAPSYGGKETIPLRRKDGKCDGFWSLKGRFTAGGTGDTIEIIPWLHDEDTGQWYPLPLIIWKHQDDLDEDYGGVVTIQAVPGTDAMYFQKSDVSAGASLALCVRGSS